MVNPAFNIKLSATVVVNRKSGEIGFRFFNQKDRRFKFYTFVLREGFQMLVDDQDFQEISNTEEKPADLKQSIDKASEYFDQMGGLDFFKQQMIEVTKKRVDLFTFTFEAFAELGSIEKAAAFANARIASASFAKQYFKHNPAIDWIAIGYMPDNIIAEGGKETEPTLEELDAIAADEGIPLVKFAREVTFQ